MSEKKFYVYLHRYASGPKEGRVFYVGKGSGDRYTVKWRLYNPYWTNIINKYGFTAEIVMRFDNEACAFSFERALIKHYGRKNLCNLTDGGDGTSGVIRSDESRAAMSKRMMGNKNAAGTVPSEETRIKIAQTKISERNPNYDPKLYTFRHELHGKFIGTQNEFNNTWMPETRRASLLTSGRLKVCSGWWIGDGPKPKRDYSKERDARSKGQFSRRKHLNVYKFKSRDGHIEVMNVPEFCEKYNQHKSQIHRMIKGQCSHCKGWVFIERVYPTE